MFWTRRAKSETEWVVGANSTELIWSIITPTFSSFFRLVIEWVIVSFKGNSMNSFIYWANQSWMRQLALRGIRAAIFNLKKLLLTAIISIIIIERWNMWNRPYWRLFWINHHFQISTKIRSHTFTDTLNLRIIFSIIILPFAWSRRVRFVQFILSRSFFHQHSGDMRACDRSF